MALPLPDDPATQRALAREVDQWWTGLPLETKLAVAQPHHGTPDTTAPALDVSGPVDAPTFICPDHRPVQHRDGKPAWCRSCKRTESGAIPARAEVAAVPPRPKTLPL